MIFAVKNIKASRVNLLMNDYAAGLPSPLSFLGLADALVRDLALVPWSGRVIPVLHSVAVSDGCTKPEMERKSRVFAPIETMEDLVGTVEVSLLIELPGCESVADVEEAMMRRRIAGGIIQNDRITVTDVTADGMAFRGLSRGYAMVRPDSHLPERLQISRGDESSLAAILDTLIPKERPPGSGWIVPVAAGYRILEDPDTTPARIRRRDPRFPHVFAEPLLGIAELVSTRSTRLTELSEEGLEALFWSWHAKDSYILGHSAYLPTAIQKENIGHG